MASLPEGSIHLGALKGNIGDQNYEIPSGTELISGAYTVLVWCEAFSVEFVGATITVSAPAGRAGLRCINAPRSRDAVLSH